MKYWLNPLNTDRADFELRYSGYRIKGVVG